MPLFKLKVKPELPAAVALMLPLLTKVVVGFTVVPVTVIVTPVQGLTAVKVKLAEPVHPSAFFATILWEPAARFKKLPDG